MVLAWLALPPLASASSLPRVASSLVAQAGTALAAGDQTLAIEDLQEMRAEIPAVTMIISEIGQGERVRPLSQLRLLEELTAAPRSAPEAAAVSASLRSVYRSSQLAGLDRRPNTSPSLLASVASQLESLLLALFHFAGNLFWMLLGLLVLAAGTALAAVLLHRSRSRLPRNRGQEESLAAPRPQMRPDHLFARADRLGEQGRFREAVRISFQALLLSASSRRVLTVDPSWTNSELLRAARRVADLEPQLRPLVSQFNAVVYGGRDPGLDGCSQFTAACRAAARSLAR